MDIQTVKKKITRQFTGLEEWNPRNGRWKGRSILAGFKTKIDDVDCYLFLGKNGLGHQKKRQPSIVPLYCEVALVRGGNINEMLAEQFCQISRILPEFKRKSSYYRYASFAENELESAGQKLIDVLLLLMD